MTYKRYLDTNYEVSPTGIVRNRQTLLELTQHPNDNGYLRVGLFLDGKQRKMYTHKIVYKTFNGEKDLEGLVIYHKDGNTKNNSINNLDTDTRSNVRKMKLKSKKHNFGKRYTEENKVFLLKKYYEEGLSARQISINYSISYTYILQVLKTNKWGKLIEKYNIQNG